MIELLPKPKLDRFDYRKVLDFPEEKAQGVTFGTGNILFLSSKSTVFRLSMSGRDLYDNPGFQFEKKVTLSDLSRIVGLNPRDYDHIGDIDFFDGLIFVPVRNRARDNNLLFVLSPELELTGFAQLPGFTGDGFCAVHPRSGNLLMEHKRESRYLISFDISQFYRMSKRPGDWGFRADVSAAGKFWFHDRSGEMFETVNSIQGIAFSPNGRLYVTRYNGRGPWLNYIDVYNGGSGLLLDRTGNNIDFPGYYDEIEGISVHGSGIIYIAVALHNNFEPDRFQIYAFRYRDPHFPV